jgi:hypothetical protein
MAALAHYSLGDARKSRQALDALAAKYAAVSAYQIAGVHAWRGEQAEAFTWLERALAQHDAGMVLLTRDPFLRSLRKDPRYTALLRKMNLPVELTFPEAAPSFACVVWVQHPLPQARVGSNVRRSAFDQGMPPQLCPSTVERPLARAAVSPFGGSARAWREAGVRSGSRSPSLATSSATIPAVEVMARRSSTR